MATHNSSSRPKLGGPVQRLRRRALPSWSVLIVALLVAGLAAANVVALQRHADANQQAMTLLARIEGLAHRLIGLEWEAEATHNFDSEIGDEVRDVQQQMHQALASFIALDSNNPATKQVDSVLRRYERDVQHLYDLYATNDLAAAHTWDVQRVDPSYDALLDIIAQTSTVYSATAQQARTTANVGSTMSMLVAAALLGLLFWRWEQTRRASAVLATEQRTLRHSEERFRSLVRNASDVFVIFESDGTVRDSSPASTPVWGHTPESLLGANGFSLVHPDDLSQAQHLFGQSLASPGTNITGEFRLQHADVWWCHCKVVVNNLLEDAGVTGIVATFRDITQRKKFEAQLTQLAFHDPLSNLPNRTLFMERLARLSKRTTQPPRSACCFWTWTTLR